MSCAAQNLCKKHLAVGESVALMKLWMRTIVKLMLVSSNKIFHGNLFDCE